MAVTVVGCGVTICMAHSSSAESACLECAMLACCVNTHVRSDWRRGSNAKSDFLHGGGVAGVLLHGR